VRASAHTRAIYVRAEGAILGGIMKVTAIPQDARGCRMASSHAADGRPPFGACRQGDDVEHSDRLQCWRGSRQSLVSSINRPGGNATGVYVFLVEMDAKRMELLRELVPNPALIAVLLNPNQTRFKTVSEEIAEAARAAGQRIELVEGATSAKSMRI